MGFSTRLVDLAKRIEVGFCWYLGVKDALALEFERIFPAFFKNIQNISQALEL